MAWRDRVAWAERQLPGPGWTFADSGCGRGGIKSGGAGVESRAVGQARLVGRLVRARQMGSMVPAHFFRFVDHTQHLVFKWRIGRAFAEPDFQQGIKERYIGERFG